MFHVNLRGCNSGLGIIRKFAQKKFTMARAIYLRTFIDFAVRWGGFGSVGSVVGGERWEQVYATYIYIYPGSPKTIKRMGFHQRPLF